MPSSRMRVLTTALPWRQPVRITLRLRRTNISIDASLIIVGAELNLNQGTIDYTRYFSGFYRLAWFKGGVPLAGPDGSVGY